MPKFYVMLHWGHLGHSRTSYHFEFFFQRLIFFSNDFLKFSGIQIPFSILPLLSLIDVFLPSIVFHYQLIQSHLYGL
eukprot:UN01988